MDTSSADTNSATVRTAATVESAGLDAALDAMAARPLEDLDVVALGRLVVDTQRDKNRLEAEHARQLATFVARRGWEADGYAGVEAWLRDRCHVSLREAGRLVDTARGLGVLPEAARAFRDGEISRDHAQVLTDTVRDLAPRDLDQGGILEAAEVAAEVDDDLLDAAKKMDPQLLGRAAKKKKDERAPEDPTAAARRRYAARRFRSWRQDGMYAFDGLLPIIDGEKLEVVLNALRTPDPKDTPEGLRRSFQQATADALIALAEHVLRTGGELPDDATPARANVTMILDWDTLVDSVSDPDLRDEARRVAAATNRAGGKGATATNGKRSGGHDRLSEDTARLGFAGDVPAGLVGRLLCDSSVARVVTGPDGLPVEAGEACPTVAAALRRAVVARDRHCRAPGCDRPAAWCEVHHVVWQRFGGKTKITTLVLLCSRHHHLVHDLGWKLDLRADGSCVWTAPAADGGGRWLTRPGDPTPHRHDEGDGIAVVAHGSLPSGADARNGDDVRDPAFPATPNGTRNAAEAPGNGARNGSGTTYQAALPDAGPVIARSPRAVYGAGRPARDGPGRDGPEADVRSRGSPASSGGPSAAGGPVRGGPGGSRARRPRRRSASGSSSPPPSSA